MAQKRISTYLKHPDEIRPFTIAWNNQLGQANVAGSTWTITPAGDLTVNSSSFTNKEAKVFLEGGTSGQIYNVENRITRSGDVAALVWEFNVEVVDH